MGLTAVGIISSPWGQRSGAHMNPAVTLTFLSLGKIAAWDALFYVLAQFAGSLTGSLACYRIYRCADGRFLTVGALEAKFWRRLCELIARPDLVGRQADAHAELEWVFERRPLGAWLALFRDEDVAVGPVATLDEASQHFAGTATNDPPPPRLGEHTAQWRIELGLT